MKEDIYIVASLDEYVCYFKNGKLHRENGPAAYFAEDKEKYGNLADKNLYKHDTLHTNMEMLFLVFDLKLESNPHYYLEGKRYDKEAFDSIISNGKIKNELSMELSSKTSNSKKVKV
jgi:hypothetical protein